MNIGHPPARRNPALHFTGTLGGDLRASAAPAHSAGEQQYANSVGSVDEGRILQEDIVTISH